MKPTLYLKRLVYYSAIKRYCDRRPNLGLIGVGGQNGAQGILDVKKDFCDLILQQGGNFRQLEGFVPSDKGRTHFGNGASFLGWRDFGSQNAVICYLRQYFNLVECDEGETIPKFAPFSSGKTKIKSSQASTSAHSKVQVLLKIGFKNVARWVVADRWKLKDEGDDAEVWKALKEPKNALYAFCAGDEVLYIGKTARSLEKRFTGYRDPGNTQATNCKCHNAIRELIGAGKDVRILVLPDQTHLHWGEFRINLAAGMEDSLVERLQPRLNGKNAKQLKTDSEMIEEQAEARKKSCVLKK